LHWDGQVRAQYPAPDPGTGNSEELLTLHWNVSSWQG
jgi:hypothetical protein